MLSPVGCASLSLSLLFSTSPLSSVCCSFAPWLSFFFHPPFLCLKDKRLHLIHPCVCPPVPENDTTPMFLVKLVSYRGGQRSVAILSPLQLAAPCWSQWEMPGRQGTRVKCPVKVCLKRMPSCCFQIISVPWKGYIPQFNVLRVTPSYWEGVFSPLEGAKSQMPSIVQAEWKVNTVARPYVRWGRGRHS